MRLLSKGLLFAAAILFATPAAQAQDFYDVDELRTVDLDFQSANWWTLLKQNYASQTDILADMTVEGVVYPDVGVRIRGNTSYTALPPGAEKVSLNITVDFVHPDQEVMGHDSLNFNNAFTDPTFCREVVYSNMAAKYIPNSRANHVIVRLNGQNWGVYQNVQQYGKRVLKTFFEDNDGLRVKCANNPSGPGLQYQGTNPASYNQYEIKDDGGLADPVGAIIDVCFAVDVLPPNQWRRIDKDFAIDPSIWTVVVENLFGDDDSYVNKGCDFVFYRNPVDGRSYLHQTDGNESWTENNWQADFHFSQNTKPFLNNVLSEPTLRARYFAHMRDLIQAEFTKPQLMAAFNARKAKIDAAVQADPKKLYSYQQFLNNFTVSAPVGLFGSTVTGIEQYIDARIASLSVDPEIIAPVPTISNVLTSTTATGVPVHITATISGGVSVAKVQLWARENPTKTYADLVMLDDGLSGDGAAGDGVYGALLPYTGVPGQRVNYYVSATTQNAFRSMSFEPMRAEMDPLELVFQAVAGPGDIVINEFLAKNNNVLQDEAGSFEDYIELYNKSPNSLDLSGMYMSDSFLTPTEWQIPAGTIIGAGQTLLIWADEDLTDGPLHADFKLGTSGDDIGLWDTDGVTLLDSVSFGPQLADVSTGRLIDGASPMVTFAVPTPDALNDGGCGLRAYDQLDPSVHAIVLDAAGTASVGSALTFTGTGFQPSGTGIMAVSATPAHFTLTSSVVALVAAPTTFPVGADGAGVVTVPLVLPADPVIAGLNFYVQVAGADAGSNLIASNGINLKVCP